jgi:CHAT domain-containing protein/tetratricopeptide (TPR) repeat protein
MRILVPILVAGGLGLAAGTPSAAQRPAPPTTDELRTQLVAHVQAGELDSVRALLRSRHSRVVPILVSIVLDRSHRLLDGDDLASQAILSHARTIAAQYAVEFGDSSQVRFVDFQERFSSDAQRSELAVRAGLEEAQRLLDAGRWRPASQSLRELVTQADALQDPYLAADARLLFASCQLSMGFLEQAVGAHGAALAAARAAHDPVRELRALEGEARAQVGLRRGALALPALRQVLQEAERRGDDDLAANALHDLGMHELTVDPLAAVRRYEAALAHARREGSARLEAAILADLGTGYGQTGDHERAVACMEQGLEVAGAAGAAPEAMICLGRRGMLQIDAEEYSRALESLRGALELADEMGAVRTAANHHYYISVVHRKLGRPELALAELEAALANVRQIHFELFEAAVLREMASVQAELGRFEPAERSLETALGITERARVPFPLVNVLSDRAALAMLRGDVVAAEQDLNRALGIARGLGRPAVLAGLDFQLGQLVAARGDRARAVDLFDAAISGAAQSGRPEVGRDALQQKARILHAEGDLAGADSLLLAASELAERVRAGLAGEEIRVGFQQRTLSLYTARAGVLYERGTRTQEPVATAHAAATGISSPFHLEAFEVAERAHARALLEVVGRAQAARPAIEPGLAQREREVTARLGALQAELSRAASAAAWDSARVDSLQHALDAVWRARRTASEAIATRQPAYGELRGQRRPLGVEDVRARVLLPDQVLLEYLVGEEETHLFLVGRDRFRMHRIPAGADTLASLVTALRAAVVTDAPEQRDLSQQLYRLLVGPVAADLGAADRLIVVPDGPLFHLPFAALHDGGAYLIQKHAIACAPSASLLDPKLRRRGRSGRHTLLAVGNPSSYRSQQLLAQARSAEGWRFGDLPFAEEEVHRIARHFRHELILTRDAASEEAVKAAIGTATDVHFATHGRLDPAEPLLSGLALAQDEDAAEDGLFQAYEILKLQLQADLVVLSACNTGLGRLAGGEGVLGLTRAFLYAGARALVMSLWEVPDRSTAELMDRFYVERFDAHVPGDVALQRAQLARLGAGDPVRAWAGFVLMGSPAVHATSSRMLLLGGWMLAAGTLCALAIVLPRRWKRS